MTELPNLINKLEMVKVLFICLSKKTVIERNLPYVNPSKAIRYVCILPEIKLVIFHLEISLVS